MRSFSKYRLVSYVICLVGLATENNLACSQVSTASPSFDVATIKLCNDPSPSLKGIHIHGGRLSSEEITVPALIGWAYEIDPRNITGGPKWITTDYYNIEAITSDASGINENRMREMTRTLLAERFHLENHIDKKVVSLYAVVIAKNGPRANFLSAPEDNAPGDMHFKRLGDLIATNSSLDDFARIMQFLVLDRPVVNRTGLSGKFDFRLTWTPDESQFIQMGVRIPPPDKLPKSFLGYPDLFEAIQEQLGLRFEAQKGPVNVFVVDQISRPSEN